MHGNVLDYRQRKRAILVVEDNEFNRQTLCTLLGDDFEVLVAENGQVGLEILADVYEDLSLVLLDVYMPVCDGFEFLRRKGADERFDGVPVIVTTAGGSVEEEIACLELGANDFVVKPYNFEILHNRVFNLIHLKESVVIVNELRWDKETGLLNKEFFYHEVTDAFGARPHDPFDIMVSDVENFKSLSDRYGEQMGQAVLTAIAEHLSEGLDGLVSSARIGTDMFAFCLEHRDLDDEAWEAVVARALGELPVPSASVKFGVVENADHALGVAQLCNRAVSALETVRGIYGRNVARFNDEIHAKRILEQAIRDSMEEALKDRQFSVVFQPKIDARSEVVGGAEALVRWTHPTEGPISPAVFIPIFERSGFITRLDRYVWDEACREIKRLEDEGLPVVPISVNVSRFDFNDPDLPQVYAELADSHQVDHRHLHIELTETAYTDNPDVVGILRAFRDLGFSVELDDFGSGYSSLVSLMTLPLDVMKLDMSMIRKATEANDFRIVESTINLAQVLGLRTVVEGVECAEEVRRVAEMGADYIQGFFFSRPLGRDEFEAYLATRATCATVKAK